MKYRRFRQSLLRNNGDGTFSDVTRTGRTAKCPTNSTYSGWADYDNDGWLDVFVIRQRKTIDCFATEATAPSTTSPPRLASRARATAFAKAPTGSISTTTIIRICSSTT